MKQREMESRALASAVNLIDFSGLLLLPEFMKHRYDYRRFPKNLAEMN